MIEYRAADHVSRAEWLALVGIVAGTLVLVLAAVWSVVRMVKALLGYE